MRGAELAKVENAVALLQQGRTAEARDELVEILRAHNAAVPAVPPIAEAARAKAAAR